MRNIYLFPSASPSPLGYHFDVIKTGSLDYAPNFGFDLFNTENNFQHRPHHLYITSDEVIKKGDWYLGFDRGKWILMKSVTNSVGNPRKKIILTTDPNLIKDGVQVIPDEFLEWFVKNPSCEYVEIKKHIIDMSIYVENMNKCTDPNYVEYEIINPKRFIRCCGRCNGVDDICYSDITCNSHKALGCEKCYGKRVEYKTSQEIINEHYSGGLDLGQINEDNYTEVQKKSLEKNQDFVNKIDSESIDSLMSEFDNYELDVDEMEKRYLLIPNNLPFKQYVGGYIDGIKNTRKKMFSQEEILEVFEQFKMDLPFHYEFLLKEHLTILKNKKK